MKTPFVTINIFFSILFSCMAQTQEGEASYYKDAFEGKKTASGEVFHQHLFTAAHRTLPFGTIVKVINQANGKSTEVRINDRGPFIRNRIIDVSKSVAQYLNFIHQGKTLVAIQVKGFSDENPSGEYLVYNETQAQDLSYTDTTQQIQEEQPKTTQSHFDQTTYANEEAVAEVNTTSYQQKSKPDILQEEKESAKQFENTLGNPPTETLPEKKQQEEVTTTSSEKSNQLHAEVVNMVEGVVSARDDKQNKKVAEEKNKPIENTKQPTINKPTLDNNSRIEKLTNQIIANGLDKQLFDLNADVIQPGFYAVQVSSLSDAKEAFKLGAILQDFYQNNVNVQYKKTEERTLYSIAIGQLSSRAEAEQLLEKVKDRYPYAFILNTLN